MDGTYRDSKQKDIAIKSTKTVQLNITNPYSNDANGVELNERVITNKNVVYNGENKRMVQILVESGLNNNAYPIKNTKIIANALKIDNQLPENILVSTRGTVATNGETEYKTLNDEWKYDEKAGTVTINTSNNKNDNKVMWKKEGKDKYIITYLFKETNTVIKNSDITVNSEITLYDKEQTTLQRSTQNNDEEIKDVNSIIEVTSKPEESEIYKGKLYSGIERNINTTTNVNVNFANLADNIIINEDSKYIGDDFESQADVYYKSLIINKQNMIDIIGEQGNIEITSTKLDGKIMITKDTQDVNGNIEVNYPATDIKDITLKITKPVKEGVLELKHNKTIKTENAEIIKSVKQIRTTVSGEYDSELFAENSSDIMLKETKTEATLELNKDNLSTLNTNNVDMHIILKSAKEENDLYKNPKIKIILPSDIDEIKINSINKVYADEFQFGKAELRDVDGIGKIIDIELVGEQANYLNVVDGIQIVINADITFSKTKASKKSAMVMKYTNEKGQNLEYETMKEFSIESKYGVLVYSTVSGYDKENTVLESTSAENMVAKLAINEDSKTVKIQRSIVNNSQEGLQNLSIIGKIPAELSENNNIETKLKNINVNLENTKIYYSENDNMDINSNEWQETVDDISTVKSYKIELPENTLKSGEVATISYELEIPENLQYNESTYEKVDLSYVNSSKQINDEYLTTLSTMLGETNVKPSVESKVDELGDVSISSITGKQELKDGDEIYEGQTVKNIVTITNNTGKDIDNLKVNVEQENGIFYVNKVTKGVDTAFDDGTHEMTFTRIVEDETVKSKDFEVEKLKNGESKVIEYEFSVKEKEGEETKGIINLSADGIENKQITTMTNKIKKAKLKLNVSYGPNEEQLMYAGGMFYVRVTAKNIFENDLNDVVLNVAIPDGITGVDMEIDGIDTENYTLESIDNGIAKVRINNIKAGESAELYLNFTIDDFKEKTKELATYATSSIDNENYISNELIKTALQEKADITVEQVSNIKTSIVKTGDELIYLATIKNNSDEEHEINIIDYVPEAAVIQNVYIVVDGVEAEVNDIKNNEIDTTINIGARQEIQLVIKTVINEDLAESLELSNTVEIDAYNQYIKSNTITYNIEGLVEREDKNNDDENIDEDEKDGGKIKGTVWFDSNKNGSMDEEEQKLKDIKVKLLDVSKNQIINETQTDDNGEYKFEEVSEGSHIVILEYDTTKYSLTEYKKSGVGESLNSDFIEKEILGKNVAATDVVEIQDKNNISLNAGLVENKIFDLRLDKYIKKITIQNTQGTKIQEYNKANLAKAELDSKYIAGSIVLVEYQIDITNEGEIPGYANEIVDYLPNGFNFNSEINKTWYMSNSENEVHNTSISNEIINPGETKTIDLTLTKIMTGDNIGTTINTAEIVKASNDLAIEDIDSTPGNKNLGEDDLSTAELILSIRTGGIVIVGAIMVITIMLISVGITIEKRRKENG